MFGKLFKKREEDVSAAVLYTALLSQSRQPQFFGAGAFADDYDGRIEVLSLHLGLLMHSLRRFGDQGSVLSQALYDVMIEDFNIALREEGLADTGISRRIKPMVALFYERAKAMSAALSAQSGEVMAAMVKLLSEGSLKEGGAADFTEDCARYFTQSADQLSTANFDEIAAAKITLAPMPKR